MTTAYAPNPAVAIAHTLMHCFTPSSETNQILEENKVSFSFDLPPTLSEVSPLNPSDVLSEDIELPDWIHNERHVREALSALADDLYKINVIDFRFNVEEVADSPEETHLIIYINSNNLDGNIENFLEMIGHALGFKEGDEIYSGLSVTNGCFNFPLTEETGIIELENFNEHRTLFYPSACHSSTSRYKAE